MLSHACFLLALACTVSATSLARTVDEAYEDPADERIFITSNGGFSLTNASAAYGAAALLCAFLIFLLFAIVFGSRWFASQQSTGYGQGQSGYGYGNSNFYARSDRHFSDADLATQMFQLAESFKKYEVTQSDCQKYVACEASQVHRHEQNGPLAKNVHQIMSNMRKHGHKTIQEKDEYMAELFGAFMFGEESLRQGKEDACAKIREKCSATSVPAKKQFE